jgi:hypothetical protein
VTENTSVESFDNNMRVMQRVLEMVRKHPTGWGGIYTSILQALPQPPQAARPKPPPAAPVEEQKFEL